MEKDDDEDQHDPEANVVSDDDVKELDKDLGTADGDHDEDEEEATAKVDEELEAAGTEAEKAEILDLRKKQRTSRGQRNREWRETMERNLQSISERLAQREQQLATLQSNTQGAQLAQVEAAEAEANKAAEYFKNGIAQAVARGDGAAVAQFTEHMIAARQKAQQLANVRVQAGRAMTAPQALDSVSASKREQFERKTTWYRGMGSTDLDSRMLIRLDGELASEGWDSRTDAYWGELEARAKKYIPHRFQEQKRIPARNPVSGGSTSSPKSGSFSFSKERWDTMKSAGLTEDPKEVRRMAEYYKEYDKMNPRT